MKIKRSYKVRLYPTKTQEAELLRILGGCRFVWNRFLAQAEEVRLLSGLVPSHGEMSRELTSIRRTTPELSNLQLSPLASTLRRLHQAQKRHFVGQCERPRPKHESSGSSSFQKPKDWRIVGTRIHVQDNLRIKTRGVLPPLGAKTGTLVIKLTAYSKWYASIAVQENIKLPMRHTAPIGVDVGLSSLAVTSKGEKFSTLKPGYDLHTERRKLQRQLARQEIGSKRREKTLTALARLQHRMENIRVNHIHQTTSTILKKNPSMVAIEDLNLKGMVKNRSLSRSLHDVSLGEFFRQIEYKTNWRGGEVVKIDRFFPSTKTCSKCGDINDKMTLATRNWTCLGCGAEHDRDINAAKNILQQAMAEVRPA